MAVPLQAKAAKDLRLVPIGTGDQRALHAVEAVDEVLIPFGRDRQEELAIAIGNLYSLGVRMRTIGVRHQLAMPVVKVVRDEVLVTGVALDLEKRLFCKRVDEGDESPGSPA
jgi:hypothetical protein